MIFDLTDETSDDEEACREDRFHSPVPAHVTIRRREGSKSELLKSRKNDWKEHIVDLTDDSIHAAPFSRATQHVGPMDQYMSPREKDIGRRPSKSLGGDMKQISSTARSTHKVKSSLQPSSVSGESKQKYEISHQPSSSHCISNSASSKKRKLPTSLVSSLSSSNRETKSVKNSASQMSRYLQLVPTEWRQTTSPPASAGAKSASASKTAKVASGAPTTSGTAVGAKSASASKTARGMANLPKVCGITASVSAATGSSATTPAESVAAAVETAAFKAKLMSAHIAWLPGTGSVFKNLEAALEGKTVEGTSLLSATVVAADQALGRGSARDHDSCSSGVSRGDVVPIQFTSSLLKSIGMGDSRILVQQLRLMLLSGLLLPEAFVEELVNLCGELARTSEGKIRGGDMNQRAGESQSEIDEEEETWGAMGTVSMMLVMLTDSHKSMSTLSLWRPTFVQVLDAFSLASSLMTKAICRGSSSSTASRRSLVFVLNYLEFELLRFKSTPSESSCETPGASKPNRPPCSKNNSSLDDPINLISSSVSDVLCGTFVKEAVLGASGASEQSPGVWSCWCHLVRLVGELLDMLPRALHQGKSPPGVSTLQSTTISAHKSSEEEVRRVLLAYGTRSVQRGTTTHNAALQEMVAAADRSQCSSALRSGGHTLQTVLLLLHGR